MRERQREALHEWLLNRQVSIYSVSRGTRFKVEWKDNSSGMVHALTGLPGQSVDDILNTLTYPIWHPREEEDRRNEPAFDRT